MILNLRIIYNVPQDPGTKDPRFPQICKEEFYNFPILSLRIISFQIYTGRIKKIECRFTFKGHQSVLQAARAFIF